MSNSNRKVLLIVVAIVVALVLVWFLVLRDTGQDEGGQSQPKPVQVEEEQAGADSPEPQDNGPQTALGVEAAAVLASYNDILQIQQQYADTCPDETTVAEVANQFDQANIASAELTASVLASDDPQAVEEAQGYLQEIETLIELSATLGPEIIERCNIDIEIPAQ